MDLLAISAIEASADFLKKSGIFVFPLALCSIAGLTAIVYKLLALKQSRILPAELIKTMEEAPRGDRQSLIQQLEAGDSVLARLGSIALEQEGEPPAEISRAVEASAREEIVRMHSGIGLLDVVITVAPLLGLLGTASGLVVIFQGLGETTDHLAIARGIAEALNTTILGLAIAVPCVIAHSYFTRRIESITARMEALMARFVSICSRQPKNPS